jgi:hypothetical protein
LIRIKNLNPKFLFFSFASVTAGVLNYLFQVYAGKTLSSGAFGQLSAWLAYVATFSVIGTIIQISSNYIHVPAQVIRRLSVIFLVLSILLIWLLPENLLYLGSIFIAASAAYAWQIGFLQSQKYFYLIGFLAILSGCVRLFGAILFTHFNGENLFSFAKAQVLAVLLSLLAFGVYFIFSKMSPQSEVKKIEKKELIVVPVIAFFYTIIPQIDVLVANSVLQADDLGVFAKAALISKALLFGLFIIAQYLLPFRNHPLTKITLRKVAGLFILCFLIVAFGSWALGPLLLSILFPNSAAGPASWIALLSCSAFLACSLLIVLQFYLVKNKSARPLSVALYFPLIYFAFRFLNSGINFYLEFNVAALLLLVIIFSRSLYRRAA